MPKNESLLEEVLVLEVRLMVREGYLPVRGSERMAWKYDDDCCGCVETDLDIINILIQSQMYNCILTLKAYTFKSNIMVISVVINVSIYILMLVWICVQ